ATLAGWKGAPCPAPVNVVADLLENYLTTYAREAYAASGHGATITARTAVQDIAEAERELEAAERERDRFANDPTAADVLDEAGWASAMRARAERVEAATIALRELAPTSSEEVAMPLDDLLGDH